MPSWRSAAVLFSRLVLAATLAAVTVSVVRFDSGFTFADLALAVGAFGSSFKSDRAALIAGWVAVTVWAMILAGADAAGGIAVASAVMGVWLLRRSLRPQH